MSANGPYKPIMLRLILKNTKKLILFALVFLLGTSYSLGQSPKRAMVEIFDENKGKIESNRELACTTNFLDMISGSSYISSGLGRYLSLQRENNKLTDKQVKDLAELAYSAIHASAYIGCSHGQRNAWAIENYSDQYSNDLPIREERAKEAVEGMKDQKSFKGTYLPPISTKR